MPKTITVTDIEIIEERIGAGDPPLYTAIYHELDESGARVGSPKVKEYSLGDSETFSTTLGLTPGQGNSMKDAQGKARTAHDKVRDHHNELRQWAKARIKTEEGI